MLKKGDEKVLGLEVGTIKHAFRDEMSQAIHWVSILAFAFVAWLQIVDLGRVVS